MALESSIESYTRFIQERPKAVIILVLLLTAFFIIPLLKIQVDSSPRLFVPDFLEAPYERLESRTDIPINFHEIYVLGKNNESVLSLESMKEQSRLVAFIRKNFDVETVSVVDVINREIEQKYGRSIEDVRDDRALGEIVYDLFSSSPRDFNVAAQSMLGESYDPMPLESRHTLEEVFPLISLLPIKGTNLPDMGFTSIDVVLKNRSLSDAQRKQLSIDIRAAVDGQNFTHIQAMHYSLFLISKDVDDKLGGSTELLAFLTLISMAALIYFGFRRIYYVFIPLFVTGIALIWAFGTAVMLDLKITALHTFVIALIVTLSVEGPVHIIKRYLEERKKKKPAIALGKTISSIFLAMFLVSFTTIAAFLVSFLLPSSPALNSFEAVVLIGISYAFILECLLVPALLTLKEYPASASDSGKAVKKITNWVFGISSRYFWVVVMLVSVAFLFSVYNLNRIETDVSAGMFVPDGMPSKAAMRIGENYATEYQPQYVLIEGNVTQPEILTALERLQKEIQDNGEFGHIGGEVKFESANTLLRQANVSDTSDLGKVYDSLRKDERIIDPVNKLSIADKAGVLVLKNGSHYDTILALVWTKTKNSDDIKNAYDNLTQDIQTSGLNDIPGIKIELSGKGFRATQTEFYVRQMQLISSVLMFIFTFLCILATYRKIVLSLLISLPIFLVSFFTLGLMPVLGMPLTWLNATVVALLIGLGVDYAIYLAERYQEELKKGKSREVAAKVSLEQTGDGIWMASFTTITGFIIVSFSILPMAQSFGLLSAISIFLVFIITIVLVPPLLIRFVRE